MPEGDNLARIADVLGSVLGGKTVLRVGGHTSAPLGRVVGAEVSRVWARGKHLLIDFSTGLTLHTHLGLHGSWHRYRAGEPWRRPARRAAVVLEADGIVCVCFDPATVELLETRALALHPVLTGLGPDVAAPEFDAGSVLQRLRQAAPPARPVGDVLLDQRLLAGLGNVYRSELCFLAGISPVVPLGDVPDEVLLGLLERAQELVAASARSGRRVTTEPRSGGSLYVYGRTGRPCRRCGTTVLSGTSGEPARRAYWCPTCQPSTVQP